MNTVYILIITWTLGTGGGSTAIGYERLEWCKDSVVNHMKQIPHDTYTWKCLEGIIIDKEMR